LFTKSLGGLPRRSGNSTRTRHFAITGLRQGSKVHARSVQQRLVAVYLIFLSTHSQLMVLQKEEEEAAKKK
jgi:hypothetical protein